jgi:uncharacterized protein
MTSSISQDLVRLTSRMLRKRLYLIVSRAKADVDGMAPVLAEHLEYMTELARKGVLFASGPLIGDDGSPTGNGLSIFNTATASEARALAERDPFYQRGLREIEVKEWILMEGAMTVTLNFAERTIDVK